VPKAKTLSDLLVKHDESVIIPKRIREHLAAMLRVGPEEHDYEQDFLTAAKIANNKIGKYREQFKAHIVWTRDKNPKRVWFADPKVAAKFRARIGASDDV